MKKSLVLYISILWLCVACGGGGGSNSLNNDSNPEILAGLVPLNVSTTDMNNKTLPYIDVALFGSHMQYKLKFTNPNSIAVTVPSTYLPFRAEMYSGDNFGDENWLFSQAGVESISTALEYASKYYKSQNPGIATTSSRFNKTTNSDDCFNMKTIPPGGSCSFYAYAYNLGLSYVTGQTMFSYPLAYLIKSLDGKKRLVVQQCTYRNIAGEDSVSYDCANESKPGYVNQFISYKMNPVNTGSTNIPLGTFSYTGSPAISNNGDWYYSCQLSGRNMACSKYTMTYQSNILTKANTPTTIINMIDQIGGGNTIQQIYPSLDGKNAWIALYNRENGYSLMNTDYPNQSFWNYCLNNTPCVPFISTTPTVFGPTGEVGFDGSFWWNTDVGADVYVPSKGTFVQTNVPNAGGIDITGTVVFVGGCYRTMSGPTGYIEQKMLNYTLPYYGARYKSMNNYVYLEMPISGFVNAAGFSVIDINAYFRVHTENGLCEVQLDDYTINTPPSNAKYSLSYESYTQSTGNFAVIPTSDIYFGK